MMPIGQVQHMHECIVKVEFLWHSPHHEQLHSVLWGRISSEIPNVRQKETNNNTIANLRHIFPF